MVQVSCLSVVFPEAMSLEWLVRRGQPWKTRMDSLRQFVTKASIPSSVMFRQ